MTATLDSIMGKHRVEIPAHLEAQAEIPMVSGKPARQGDVMVIPMRAGKVAGAEPVPPEGIAVVRGDGGNTHLLVSLGGTVLWAPNKQQGADQGTLVIEDGGAALIHPEHGAVSFAPGAWLFRRQREQADIERLVAD